jgi:hypothetical protein
MNSRLGLAVLATLALGALSACVVAPPREEPAPMPPPPPPIPQLYVYPNNGQSSDQQDRDRYECNSWAVKQTGFDPSQPQLPPHERVQIVAGPPPGVNTVGGAITGAIIGSILTGPRGGGAVVGAVAGGLLGANADAANQAQAAAVQNQYDQRDLQAQARLDQQARYYRRAISACLEARGYTVK